MTIERALAMCSPKGGTWTTQTGAGTLPWSLMSASSTCQTAYFVPYNYNTIYKSTDYATTVSVLGASFSNINRFVGLDCSSDGSVIAVTGIPTSYGQIIYRSTNSGSTWSGTGPYKDPASDPYFWFSTIRVSSTGQKMAVVGQDFYGGGYIWTSSDYGANWTQRSGTGTKLWAGLAGSSDLSILYATGVASYGSSTGVIYKSTDSGATWTQITSLSYIYPGAAIAVSANGNIVLFANNNTQYLSTDGGSTWVNLAIFSGGCEGANSVSMSSDGSVMLACKSGGSVYLSANSGSSWSEQGALGTYKNWTDSAMSADGKKIIVGYRYPSPTYLSTYSK